jgi:hypothetical protein
MAYLKEEEITSYTNLPGITMADVIRASELVDSYKGQTFLAKEYKNEVQKLKKKRQGYYETYRGQLNHLPRITITSITSDVPTPFGGFTKQTYNPSLIEFDADDEEYFSFMPQTDNQHNIFPSAPPSVIKVTYTAGYTSDNIPEALKVACGLICDNAKQNGGYRGFKSRTDFDLTIAFSEKEDPVLSSNVIRLINSVVLK